jgi:hypothetical protein
MNGSYIYSAGKRIDENIFLLLFNEMFLYWWNKNDYSFVHGIIKHEMYDIMTQT